MATNETLIEDVKKLVIDIMSRSKYAKTELCKDEAMSDNPPMFFIGYESDEGNPEHEACLEGQQELSLSTPYQLAMIPLIHKPDPFAAYEDVVRCMPIEKFDFLAMCLEGYLETSKDKPKNIADGSLQKDYEENPFSTVRECLIVTAVDWESSQIINLQCSYRYDDSGVPVWDEEEELLTDLSNREEGESYGRYPDGLLDTVRYMHLATKAMKYKNILDQAPPRNKES
jgi:hypothetical protein